MAGLSAACSRGLRKSAQSKLVILKACIFMSPTWFYLAFLLRDSRRAGFLLSVSPHSSGPSPDSSGKSLIGGMCMGKDATVVQDAAAGDRVHRRECSQEVKDSRIRLRGSPYRATE